MTNDLRIRIHRTSTSPSAEPNEISHSMPDWLDGIWDLVWRLKWLGLILFSFAAFLVVPAVKKHQGMALRVEAPFKACLESLDSRQLHVRGYRKASAPHFKDAASSTGYISGSKERHAKMKKKYAKLFRSRLTKALISEVDWLKQKGWIAFVEAYADSEVVSHMDQLVVAHQAELAKAKAAALKTTLEAMAKSVHVFMSAPSGWKEPSHFHTSAWQVQADSKNLGFEFRETVRQRIQQLFRDVPITYIDTNENKPISKDKLGVVHIHLSPMEVTSWIGGRWQTVMIGCHISLSADKTLMGPRFEGDGTTCGPTSFSTSGDKSRVDGMVTQARDKARADLSKFLNGFSLRPGLREELIKAAKQ